MSFFLKTFLSVFFGACIACALSISYAYLSLEKSILEKLTMETLSEAELIAQIYNTLPREQANEIIRLRTNDIRISLLDSMGNLIGDSHIKDNNFSPAYNYADRPEVKNALEKNQGTDTRHHDELKTQAVFAAVRLNDGNIIRLATPTENYLPFSPNRPKVIVYNIFLIFLLSFMVAYLRTRPLKHDLMQAIQTIKHFAKGKYQMRLSNLQSKEFYPLAAKVNHMATQIEEHIRIIADQKEQLQSILDTMNEGVLVLGPNGSIRRFNRALKNMFPSIEQCIGKQVVEAIPVPSLHTAIENIIKSPPQNGEIAASNGPLQLQLAPERIFSIQLTRAGSNDLNLGAVAVFHDISGLMRLERIRSDFVANVSHELRTPLTSIQGYAETLAELEDMPENSRRFAEIIRKHGAYLARMVEELLALARLESGDVPMPILETNPLESINAAIALCRRQFNLQEIEIVLQLPDNIIVMASAQHLTQVFRNLLENAGRYAPKGGQVVIKALQDDAENNTIRFAVCDNGPGIPAPDKDRIFERFYRVEKHRSHASTGLGLAICKHTVERLGGRIWVESPTEEFSTVFYFTIPTALGDAK